MTDPEFKEHLNWLGQVASIFDPERSGRLLQVLLIIERFGSLHQGAIIEFLDSTHSVPLYQWKKKGYICVDGTVEPPEGQAGRWPKTYGLTGKGLQMIHEARTLGIAP